MDEIIIEKCEHNFVKSVCDTILSESIKSIKNKGFFTLVLSGGNTPVTIFKKLIDSYADKVQWDKTHFFWLDERCVSPKNNNSNFKNANDFLISKLKKIGSINRIEGELAPAIAAEKYEKRINKFFNYQVNFDFVMIGMGLDGHIASIFPNETLMSTNQIVFNTDDKHENTFRVSLSLSAIKNIKYRLLILKGNEKLKILNCNSNKKPVHLVNYSSIIMLK